MAAYTGILIDPINRTVTNIPLDNSTIDDLHEAMQCQIFTVGGYLDDKGNCLYVDDEGLFVPPTEQGFFRLKGIDNTYAGRSIVIGTDEEGQSITPSISREIVETMVQWMVYVP